MICDPDIVAALWSKYLRSCPRRVQQGLDVYLPDNVLPEGRKGVEQKV